MSHIMIGTASCALGLKLGVVVLFASTAAAGQPLGYAPVSSQQIPAFERIPPTSAESAVTTARPANSGRRIVAYPSREQPGTIVVDTPNTKLYYVLGGGQAIRYGIGVGRDGFTWSGVRTIERKSDWPDWIPPAEMLKRQPYLPRFVAGGPGNPLGARALYLAGTFYRIHGTNAPETIGGHVSSGCIRMMNEDVIDLYGRVSVGTKVVVLPDTPRHGSHVQARVSATPDAQPVKSAATITRAFGLY